MINMYNYLDLCCSKRLNQPKHIRFGWMGERKRIREGRILLIST